jgi:hypothetical protein
MLTRFPEWATALIFSTADEPCDWWEIPDDWLDEEARARGGTVEEAFDALLVQTQEVCPGGGHTNWIHERYQRAGARSASALLVHIVAAGAAGASDRELEEAAVRLVADAVLLLRPDGAGVWGMRWLDI